MSSLRRIEASRANGRRSTGPVTPEGKFRSSQNAIRHGMLSRIMVLDYESPDAFQKAHDSYIQHFQPADEVELEIVEDLVAAAWRRRRSWAIENASLNQACADIPGDPVAVDRIAAAFQTLAAGPSLALLHRYQARLDLEYHRALKNLQLLRGNIPNEPNPISEHPEPPTDPAPEPPESPNPPADPAPQFELESHPRELQAESRPLAAVSPISPSAYSSFFPPRPENPGPPPGLGTQFQAIHSDDTKHSLKGVSK